MTLTKVDSAAIPAGPYYDDYNSESYIMKGYTSDYTENTVLAVAFKYDGSNWVNQVLNSYVAAVSYTHLKWVTVSRARAFSDTADLYYDSIGEKIRIVVVGN